MTTLMPMPITVERFAENPLIVPDMDDRMGSNINGPSVIRVPEWVREPLGKYYMYFAHHVGTYIRLAYSDHLRGPWRMHTPGVLDARDAFFDNHIASPDVRIRPEHNEIHMYYHGCCLPEPPRQFTRVATSGDGLHFVAQPQILGTFYWRTFEWRGHHYALAMPGQFYRSPDGLNDYQLGPCLFTPDMRHAALRLTGNTLQVFYSRRGDAPERILLSTIDLTDDWMDWRASDAVDLLMPETAYEGALLPLMPSKIGAAHEPVRQLRDPAIFEEDGRTYLFYSIAGEHGIAGAELKSL